MLILDDDDTYFSVQSVFIRFKTKERKKIDFDSNPFEGLSAIR